MSTKFNPDSPPIALAANEKKVHPCHLDDEDDEDVAHDPRLTEEPDSCFRRNVACVVLCAEDPSLVLGCKRIAGDGWQLVQGGVNSDEDLIMGAWREIYEEVGLVSDYDALREAVTGGHLEVAPPPTIASPAAQPAQALFPSQPDSSRPSASIKDESNNTATVPIPVSLGGADDFDFHADDAEEDEETNSPALRADTITYCEPSSLPYTIECLGVMPIAPGTTQVGPNGNRLRYIFAPGTALSLVAKGFIGQDQTPVVFIASRNATDHLDLSGLGGEKPEFTEARWMTFSELEPLVPKRKRHIISYLAQLAPSYAYNAIHRKPRTLSLPNIAGHGNSATNLVQAVTDGSKAEEQRSSGCNTTSHVIEPYAAPMHDESSSSQPSSPSHYLVSCQQRQGIRLPSMGGNSYDEMSFGSSGVGGLSPGNTGTGTSGGFHVLAIGGTSYGLSPLMDSCHSVEYASTAFGGASLDAI